MVSFNSYVKLPEGNTHHPSWRWVAETPRHRPTSASSHANAQGPGRGKAGRVLAGLDVDVDWKENLASVNGLA